MPNKKAYLYTLNGKVPEACLDIGRWGKWFETADRTVAREELMNGDVVVSTVFIGFDHCFDGGEPLLFESMVFGEEHLSEFFKRPMMMRDDLEMRRYHTWDEAEKGHQQLVAQYRAAAAEAIAAASAALSKRTPAG